MNGHHDGKRSSGINAEDAAVRQRIARQALHDRPDDGKQRLSNSVSSKLKSAVKTTSGVMSAAPNVMLHNRQATSSRATPASPGSSSARLLSNRVVLGAACLLFTAMLGFVLLLYE